MHKNNHPVIFTIGYRCVFIYSITPFKLGCFSGWKAYNGHCYIRISTQLSFNEAQVSLFFNLTWNKNTVYRGYFCPVLFFALLRLQTGSSRPEFAQMQNEILFARTESIQP